MKINYKFRTWILFNTEELLPALNLQQNIKLQNTPKHYHWVKLQDLEVQNTRSKKPKYKQPICRSGRFKNSPIPYLTRLLNTYQSKWLSPGKHSKVNYDTRGQGNLWNKPFIIIRTRIQAEKCPPTQKLKKICVS